MERLSKLHDTLRASQSLEEAVSALLSAVRQSASEALAASRFAQRGELLRAALHLRPDGVYQGFLVLEHDQKEAQLVDKQTASATMWQWMEKHRCPLSLDVTLRILHIRGERELVEEEALEDDILERNESLQVYLNQGATHIRLLPLWDLVGNLMGMVTVEARCRAAMGSAFIWSESLSPMQLLLDTAAPYLRYRPLAPPPTEELTDDFLPVVGVSMARTVRMLRVFARQGETLLLCGPTGAGKTRMAHWCHAHSPQAEGSFEVVDLLSVPESMQMAHLVGWKRGAFTGADRTMEGALARAEGGTLFIDEIDKLSMSTQAGLLKILEEKRYRPLGDHGKIREADVRFVVGTNLQLKKAVQEGKFREDLYYRINILPVLLPGLDERVDEIPAWANFMARRWATMQAGVSQVHLTPDACAHLQRRSWPGNLRQRDNVVRRAGSLALLDTLEGAPSFVIDEPHIHKALTLDGPEPQQDLNAQLHQAARIFIKHALELQERGESLDLDLANAFRGYVLEAAVKQLGHHDQAFELLGKSSLLRNRNHHRAYQNEQKRVATLLKRLQNPI